MLRWTLFGNLLLCFIMINNANAQAWHALKQSGNYLEIIPAYQMQNYDQEIKKIYQTILSNKQRNLLERIALVSNYFINRPYLLGALGEGPQGEFDQQPLYRTDTFDCMTYVETVLALSEAKNSHQFKVDMQKIRYAHGHVSYIDRNHFTSVDWNINNQKSGYIKDITAQFSVPYNITNTLIDKPNWYRTLPANNLKLLYPVSSQQAQILLGKFRTNAQAVQAVVSHTKYLPLTELFSNENGMLVPNEAIFSRIPTGSIIEIVRNNYDLTATIGTRLNVTHMGFAIRTSQGLMFREASEVTGQVMDIPLVNYLAGYYKFVRYPAHVGINIEKIAEKNPS